jgi:basic amino acid/polyamine antiporter, APA family
MKMTCVNLPRPLSSPSQPQLVRGIGRWSLAALVINSVVGAGIFGLPSIIARLLGSQSVFAHVLAAVGNGLIMGCFAELASRFSTAGGPYLYAREGLGRFAGIQIGWMSWLVRVTAVAAAANLFTIYLAEFWPAVQQPLLQAAVLAVLLGFLAAVNYRGVRSGTNVSNFFTIAKLLPLGIFLVAGAAFVLLRHPTAPPIATSATSRQWVEAVVLLVFAYGGFDGAMLPLGEAKNPRKDAPFALFTAMAAVFIVYAGVQLIVLKVLPDPVASTRPLADAARVFLGTSGGVLMALGALVSVYGYLSANMLNAPRLTFALGERRDFPPFFAWLHPRFHTPYISILAFVALVWLLAVVADFRWNALLSGVARLFTYGSACVSLIVLRRRQTEPALFRLPAGDFLASLGLIFCLALMLRMGRAEAAIILTTFLIALVNWWWAQKTEKKQVETL